MRRRDAKCSEQMLEVVTPRTNTARLSPAEHLFAALVLRSGRGTTEPVALEISADADRRRFFVRTGTAVEQRRVAGIIGAAYPQAGLRPSDSATFPTGDPDRLGPDEQVVAAFLRLLRLVSALTFGTGGRSTLAAVFTCASARLVRGTRLAGWTSTRTSSNTLHTVLTAVTQIQHAADARAAAEARDRTVMYFTKRLVQVQYATFQRAGYPIGSGPTESANKIVVEARLKGSGMHWARAHVDPLVALRTVACANRWSEASPRICARLRAEADQRRRSRWCSRRQTSSPAPAESTPPTMATVVQPRTTAAPSARRAKSIVIGRPTALHPWKRYGYDRVPHARRDPRSRS